MQGEFTVSLFCVYLQIAGLYNILNQKVNHKQENETKYEQEKNLSSEMQCL